PTGRLARRVFSYTLRELRRQAEARESLRCDECRDFLDPGPLERDDVDRLGLEAPRFRVLAVVGDRRLTVCTYWKGARRGAGLDGVLGPVRDSLASAPPAGPRGHRKAGVLGEKHPQRIHVAPRPGIDVRLDELADSLIAQRARRLLLALLGQTIRDGLASALQSAVHGGDRRVQLLRDLSGREAEDLAEDQHSTLRRR